MRKRRIDRLSPKFSRAILSPPKSKFETATKVTEARGLGRPEWTKFFRSRDECGQSFFGSGDECGQSFLVRDSGDDSGRSFLVRETRVDETSVLIHIRGGYLPLCSSVSVPWAQETSLQLQAMAGVVCPVSSSTLPRASISLKPWESRHSAGAVNVSAPGWGKSERACGGPTLVHTSSRSRPSVVCKAFDKDQIAQAKKFQMQATEVLAELLKSKNPQATASKYLDHLSEEFFMVASTYLEMAKKEGNVEVMKKIEEVLEIAMTEKGKTLRPEIQLMNKLLNESDQYERAKTIKSNSLYIMDTDGYFYELLQRMNADVENLKDSPKKQKLLTQLRTVSREVKEAGKALRRAK